MPTDPHASVSTADPLGANEPSRPARMTDLGGSDPLLARRTEIVLRELGSLPTLPSIALRLLSLGATEDVDIKEVVRVIETDPTLTARLLALCKKASHKTRIPITTVEMAVVMLGLDAVRSLVLSVQIYDWSTRLPRRPESTEDRAQRAARNAPGFERIGFWQHSVAAACAAELIAREHGSLGFHPEEAFVCGLLHDVGKLALELVLPKAYARVIELAERRGCALTDAERMIVGLNHAQAGARLADSWGLPGFIRDSMAMHHGPRVDVLAAPEPNQRMIWVVVLADGLARRMGLGWSGNHAPLDEEREICRRIGLAPERLASIPDRLYEATSSRLRDLGLGDEPSQQILVDSILRANTRLANLNHELIRTNDRLERTRDELAEARSLARLGQMTAGAAHEMNNPLAVISGRAQTLIDSLREERDRGAARAIVEATRRLSSLIMRLNRIATPPSPQRRPVGIADLLATAVSRARQRFAERPEFAGAAPPVVGVKVFVPDGLPACGLDRELMTEAMVEIIANALEALPRTGVDVRVTIEPGDRLVLTVTDDGAGMSKDALAHALDPFYSNKPAGRQSGLGLALAQRLVTLHEGDLALGSLEGQGTTVTIALPRWRAEREEYAAEARAAA